METFSKKNELEIRQWELSEKIPLNFKESFEDRGLKYNPVNLLTNHFLHSNVYPANQTDAQMTAGQTAKSNGKSKICLVCGDVSKSNHFGALCCCSCKAFFRRSVQNESYKTFHCPYNSNCEITILSRKCCQFCRFEKCVSIGMEISWVMSEEERLQLLKR